MSWGRRRGRSDDWGWPPYVPVAERRARALKQAEKLRKKGQPLAPVVIAGRTIAATFWGNAWCENLERYGDYENRIPRGRTYVRNGSVVDLKIGTARVDALVSGSHLYSVAIEIRSLKAEVWRGVKGACTGRIGSLLELLQGKLSREVMEIVTRPRSGLFPEPAEISFRCSCPDWASMCKHVAAVLYGVGARLDREPELLFCLRGVDHRELIAAPGAADLAASPGMRDMIAEEDLAGIFGIEIDEGPAALRSMQETPEPARLLRGRTPKPADSAETPEPPKRKWGRPRLTPKAEAMIKPHRGRPPLVLPKTPLPWEQQAVGPAETPEPPKRKRGRPRLTPKAETLIKPRRGKPPLVLPKPPLPWEQQPVGPAEAPEPPKRKRGRPRLTPKVEALIKPRRGRPPLVLPKTSLPWEQQAVGPAEAPEPPKRKRGRPMLTPRAEAIDKATPLPDRLKWARGLKPPPPAETPEPVKRKRGRPPGKRKA